MNFSFKLVAMTVSWKKQHLLILYLKQHLYGNLCFMRCALKLYCFYYTLLFILLSSFRCWFSDVLRMSKNTEIPKKRKKNRYLCEWKNVCMNKRWINKLMYICMYVLLCEHKCIEFWKVFIVQYYSKHGQLNIFCRVVFFLCSLSCFFFRYSSKSKVIYAWAYREMENLIPNISFVFPIFALKTLFSYYHKNFLSWDIVCLKKCNFSLLFRETFWLFS